MTNEELRQKYLQMTLEKPVPEIPTSAGVVSSFKPSKGGGIMKGLGNIMSYLGGSQEGKQILSGLVKDPYMKEGLLKQAEGASGMQGKLKEQQLQRIKDLLAMRPETESIVYEKEGAVYKDPELKTSLTTLPKGARIVKVPLTVEEQADKEAKKLSIKTQAKQETKKVDIANNLKKVENLMSNTMAQFKAKIEEQGGGGILGGMKGKVGTALKLPQYSGAASFQGQRFETALALNSILTNQNRVIEGVLNKILTTLPDDLDTPELAAQKIAQSFKNSYGLMKAMQNAGLTDEYLNQFSDADLRNPNSEVNVKISSLSPSQLSPEEEKELDSTIQRIINVKPAKKFKIGAEESDPMGLEL